MNELTITGATGFSRILEGFPFSGLSDFLPHKNLIILTDDHLSSLYLERFPEARVIVLPHGEQSKDLSTLETCYLKLLEFGADRDTFILGIGGGVICDITGFVASTFMRGLSFGFVPTSLLAQVDASLGGKNGVNLKKIKNMVGVFRHPEIVFCDPAFLTTLPEKEFLSGLTEVVKHALIYDIEYYHWLQENWDAICNLDTTSLNKMIWRSIQIKKEVVEKDEKEEGLRRILNFGHTFGHAIELVHGFTHGESVAYGILVAVYISLKEALLQESSATEISTFIETSGLLNKQPLKGSEICKIFRTDKKRTGTRIQFVLLSKIGRTTVIKLEQDMLEKYFIDWLNDFNQIRS